MKVISRKEIAMDVLNFTEGGKVPVDFLAHPQIISKLMEYWEICSERELLDALNCDFYYLSGRDISQNEGALKFYKGHKAQLSEKERICPLGIHWTRGAFNSKFSVDEAICGPFQDTETVKEILDYDWPKAGDFDFSALHEECEANSGRVITGGLWTGLMGDCYRMMGFQKFLLETALRPELVKALIDRMTEMYMELNDKYFSELKGKFDIWFTGSDFGSQNGLILSPESWYGLFYENIRKLTGLAHSYGLKVMLHSCGAITPIIPYLIDAGVDILDPVQITARGMEPETLSGKFGGKIVFHGGIDTQNVLPYGTAEDVALHVDKIVEVLGNRGGYIFAPSQTLGPDIPVENVVAMYSQIEKINGKRPG